MRGALPSGTVTFLFTDVEGSTKLLHALGAEAYADALAAHRRAIRDACAVADGVEVNTWGDAFFFAFPTGSAALAAAALFDDALAAGPIQVRVGIHTGTPLLTAEGYVGTDVHRAARIAAAGHGGQVLVSAATAALVGTDGLHDLGEHRFKDLSAAERVYQLGETTFPPLRTLYRTNLPVPVTPFVGRDRELAELVALIGRDDVRLVTLTGPGGTGKTRLALAAAGLAAEAFPDGVWWIPLAPIRDPTLVLATAGQVLGSKNGLAEHIANRRMLCLFDNFEQVVDAAPGIGELLAACPNIAVVVTSRERLRLRGEQAYPVPPLAETDGEALFITRAQAADPAFTADAAVGELCRRLDELPLAIELAAARMALFSPSQLLERLGQRLDLLRGARDADPRQHTLRATLSWSHGLLTDDERRLFRRLSVFRGGSTYEATEAIAGADPDTLGSLVDKSLIRRRDTTAGPRFAMLETIRAFATEQLDASGEADEIRRRHAAWLLALARQLPPFVAVTREWLESLDPELDNLRAALDRLPEHGDTRLALELAESIWRYLKMRGHQAESARRFEALLACDVDPTVERGHALNAAAGMAVENGEFETGRRYAREALEIHRTHDDRWGIARSTFMLGYAEIESGAYATALPLFEETLRQMKVLGYPQYIGIAAWNLAWAARELGQTDLARSLYEEVLAISRTTGSVTLEAQALNSFGFLALHEGRREEALRLMQQALRIRRDVGDLQHTLLGLSDMATIHAAMGNHAVAARLVSSSQAIATQAALRLPDYERTQDEETLERVREALGADAFAEACAVGATLPLDRVVAIALAEDEEAVPT